MCLLREATLGDIEGINSVSRHLGYKELPSRDVQKKLQSLINSSTDFVYIVEINHRVVAWLHLFTAHRLASADFFEIAGLVVCPSYRRQGIAKSLLQHVKSKHSGKLRVRCNEKRIETHAFYESLGFESKKRQRVFELKP